MALKLIYQLFANLLSWMVLQVAGQDAARQGAHREAAGHFAAATPHASRLAEPERGALFERYAAAAYLAGHIEAALAARGMALRVREGLGQRELVGENLRWISRLSWWTGRRIEAREAAGRAVAVLEVAPPSRELAMAYSNQSQLRAVAYEFEEAVTWGERARDLAQRLGDEETAIHATITMNTARLIPGDPLAEAALAEVHERAAAAGLVDHAARALINLAGTVSEELARYADAAPLLERALDYAARQELDGWTGWLLGARAKIRLERCEWKGALADAHAALERSDGLGVHAVLPMVVLGRIRAACGAVDALSILDEADPATHHDATHRRGVPVSLRLKASGSTRRLSCGSSGRSASRRWR